MGKIQADFSSTKSNSAFIKKDNLGEGSVISSNLTTLDRGFFPVLGNHDYDDSNRDGTEYLQFFKFLNKINGNTSGTNKYYDFVINDCHFFVLDSDPVCGGSAHAGNISDPYPAGKGTVGSTSNNQYTQTQKSWFNNRIKQSISKYKFVFQHHPPYNSGVFHRGYPKLSPHKGWKTHLANAVFSGHEHFYERIKFVSQYPNYISVTRMGNQLKIEYSSSGPLFETSQLRIHIGNDDWQNLIDASTSSAYMYRQQIGSGGLENWTYIYNIPEGADYINFAFRSNGGSWDNNVINNWVYDYIYYLNDSNNFNKPVFIVNGNSGHDLRSFSDQPIPQSLFRINDKYGFTEVRIYQNGIKYIHYGIANGENSFSVADEFIFGDCNNEQDYLLSFAVIADWGNGGDISSIPNNFFDPPNNYYANKIAEEIKYKNIKYVFGVGDLSYNGILYRVLRYSSGHITQEIPNDRFKESPPDDIDPILRDPNSQGSGSGSGSGSSPVGLNLFLNKTASGAITFNGELTNVSINTDNIEIIDCTLSNVKGIYYKNTENDNLIIWSSNNAPYMLVLYKNLSENTHNNYFWNLFEISEDVVYPIATNQSTDQNFIPQYGWLDDEEESFILNTAVYSSSSSSTNEYIIYTTFNIDNNVGRFYYDYITCYQGLYIDKNTIDDRYLKDGLVPYNPICLNTFKNYA